jgi:hypothetical protein
MDTYFPHQLGQLMCEATLRILWPPAADWLGRRAAGSALHCRVGTGKATYHRYDPQRRHHLITYGMRMVAAKQEAGTADGWLSTREILARGYFDGELSTLNLLAHTCCHEFAHLLQCSAGQRRYGSVHNRHFYTILDELHSSGGADATRQYLATEARAAGVHLPSERFSLPDDRQQARSWQVGEPVTFGHGRQRRHGQIVRVNRKTCTVEGVGEHRGSRYRVPLSMLQKRP